MHFSLCLVPESQQHPCCPCGLLPSRVPNLVSSHGGPSWLPWRPTPTPLPTPTLRVSSETHLRVASLRPPQLPRSSPRPPPTFHVCVLCPRPLSLVPEMQGLSPRQNSLRGAFRTSSPKQTPQSIPQRTRTLGRSQDPFHLHLDSRVSLLRYVREPWPCSTVSWESCQPCVCTVWS